MPGPPTYVYPALRYLTCLPRHLRYKYMYLDSTLGA